MSTKTLRKRIALVAVSAMGFGLLTSISANAAVASPTSIALNKGSIIAGSSSVTLTVTGGSAVIGLKAVSPLGAATYWVTETAAAGATEATAATDPAYAAGVFTFSASYFREPGAYTFLVTTGATTEVDAATEIETQTSTAAKFKVATLRVDSPATASTLGASMDAGNYTGLSTTPVITAWRPTTGVTGAIKLRWDRSPDTDVTVGSVATGTNTGVSDSYNYFSNSESDVAGTYSATVWVDTNANGIVDASEPSQQISYVVTSASASTDVITVTTSKTVANDNDVVTFCASATDAYGRPLVDALQVKVDLDYFDNGVLGTNLAADTYVNMTRQGSSTTYCTSTTVDTSALATDYKDITVTVANSGGTATDATTVVRVVNTSLATIDNTAGAEIFKLASGDGVGSVTSGVRQTLYSTGGSDIGTSAAPIAIDKAVTTQSFSVALATTEAGEYVKVVVAPRAGTSSAVVAPSTSYKQVSADGTVKFVVTSTAPAATNGYSVTVSGSRTSVAYIQYGTPTPTITISPTATIKAKYGSTTPLTATLTDQFNRPMASKVLVYNVSGGRNATVTGTLTTGTDGSVAYSLKDAAGSADTVNLTDTVTFTYNYLDADGAGTSASASRSVTYDATGVVVGSITLTPASTADVTISQSSNTGSTTYVAYTAQVYLATGLPAGSGVLVTCSAGADDLFLLGVKTAVTGTDGTATCNLYRVKAGTIAATASAGGVSSNTSAAVTFVNDGGGTAADGTGATGASDARNVAVTSTKVAAGSAATVVAKVTDRWGNPVAGVLVTWSYAGVGRPVTGADLTVGTDTNGQAQIQLTSLADETGTATVTATIGTATNQTLDLAGYVGALTSAGAPAGNYVASGTVTFTAPVATVSNAEVLAAIVKLIASINKQITALQKLLTKKK